MDHIKNQVFGLIEQGRRDESIKLLYDLVVDSAEKGDFDKAEGLRQILIQTNSMALTEIVASGEILEEKKYHAIDPVHKKSWRRLYRDFSNQEAVEFYYNLKTLKIKPGKVIIQQSKFNDKLFFVNEGKLKNISRSEKHEFFLKEVFAGEVFGLPTFFSISTATTSVITNSEVNISYITQKSLYTIAEKIPGFDTKLNDICKGLVRIDITNIIKKQGFERRKYQRFLVDGWVIIHLVGTDGKQTEQPFQGAFNDISIGGASFTIKSTSHEYARSLLGSKAIIKLTLKNSENESVGIKEGWIVSLCDHLFDNYLISFRFHTPLSRKILHQLVKK